MRTTLKDTMEQAPRYASVGVRLDYETEARDLAASVLILAAALQEWDGESVQPSDILNATIVHAARIIDSPVESRIFVP